MAQGWIKVHRRLLDDDLWHTLSAEQLKVFLYLLLIAEHQERVVTCKRCGQDLNLMPGDVMVSSRQIAAKCNISHKVARNSLDKLKRAHTLALKGHICNTLHAIENWDKYQTVGTSPGIERAHHRAPKGHIIYKEEEEKKKEEKKKETKSDLGLSISPPPSSDALRTADYLRECIVRNKPNHLIADTTQWNKKRTKWAKELDRAHTLDRRSWHDLCLVIKWATADEFWAPNIQSATKLRQKYDQLEAKMNQSNKPRRPQLPPGTSPDTEFREFPDE